LIFAVGCVTLKIKSLNYLEKRRILNTSEVDLDSLVAQGNFCLEKGAINDALEFFEKAQFEEGLRKIRSIGLDEGDVFIFRKVNKILKISDSREDLNRIGERALKLGKIRYAIMAFEATGNKEMVEEVKRSSERK
jgi:hypothetical protein